MEEEAEALPVRRYYAGFGCQYDDDDLLRYQREGYGERRLRKLKNGKKVEFIASERHIPACPPQHSVGVSYILLAVDEGWVKISEINLMRRAAWIYGDGQGSAKRSAQDAMDEDLPRMPCHPDNMVGYVAVTAELGLSGVSMASQTQQSGCEPKWPDHR